MVPAQSWVTACPRTPTPPIRQLRTGPSACLVVLGCICGANWSKGGDSMNIITLIRPCDCMCRYPQTFLQTPFARTRLCSQQYVTDKYSVPVIQQASSTYVHMKRWSHAYLNRARAHNVQKSSFQSERQLLRQKILTSRCNTSQSLLHMRQAGIKSRRALSGKEKGHSHSSNRNQRSYAVPYSHMHSSFYLEAGAQEGKS